MMFAVVWFPDFALQTILRSEPFAKDAAVALLRETHQQSLIHQANSHARHAGVSPGNTVSQAIARCGSLQVRAPRPLAAQQARATVFAALYSITPMLEATAEDRYTLELQGIPTDQQQARMLHLHGVLRASGFLARIGVARHIPWAHYAAKCATNVLRVEDVRPFFDKVSLSLAIDEGPLLELLTTWGLHSLGDFARLPLQSVSRRLGSEGTQLWLDLHHPSPRLLKPMEPPESFEAWMEVETGLHSLEPLLFVIHRLLSQLCLQLSSAFQEAKVLCLELQLEDGTVYRRSFRLPEPTTRVERLRAVLHTHLEQLNTSSSIQAVGLRAVPAESKPRQQQLFRQHLHDPWKLSTTLHQLIGLVGSGNVGSPRLNNSHEPDSFEILPPAHELDPLPDEGRACTSAGGLALQRFRPPFPAYVDTREGRPVRVASQVFEGAICDSRGPWHASGSWWDNRHWERMEWDVAMQDEVLLRLVFERNRWWVEGAYG
jgi:protein ImuB